MLIGKYDKKAWIFDPLRDNSILQSLKHNGTLDNPNEGQIERRNIFLKMQISYDLCANVILVVRRSLRRHSNRDRNLERKRSMDADPLQYFDCLSTKCIDGNRYPSDF